MTVCFLSEMISLVVNCCNNCLISKALTDDLLIRTTPIINHITLYYYYYYYYADVYIDEVKRTKLKTYIE